MSGLLLSFSSNIIQVIYFLFIFFVFFFIGKFAIKYFFPSIVISRLEFILYSISLGIGVVVYLVFFLGVFGILYKNVIIIISALIFLLGVRNSRSIPLALPDIHLNKSYLFPGIIISLFLLLNFLCCFAPETFYDSLLYHLAIPVRFLQEHKIFHLKYLVFSGLSSGLEMIYTVALSFGNEILAKLIHFSMGIGILVSLYGFGKKLNKPFIGILAASIFYSIPVVSTNSVNTQVDLAMTFFALISLLALFNWHISEKPEKGPLVLSALFSGIAMSIKYTAVFSIIGINFVIFWSIVFNKKESLYKFLRVIVIYDIIIFLLVLPWFIKNFIFTSNPFYPYFAGIKSMAILLTEQKGMMINSLQSLIIYFKEIAFTSKWGSIRLGFVPLLGLILFIIPALHKKSTSFFTVFFIFSLMPWLFVTRLARYNLYGLAILSLITAYQFCLIKEKSKITAYILYLLIVSACLYNFLWTAELHFRNMQPLKVAVGLESKSSYLSRERPTYPNPSYPAIEYINKTLDKNAGVLFVGETRGFYCERRFITHTVYDNNLLQDFLESSNDEEKLLQDFKENSITHILCNFNELRRLKSCYSLYNFTTDKAKLFDDFLKKHCKIIYHLNNIYLFEIVN